MSETTETNPLASGVATWRELEACADDYDIRAQACDRIPINVIGHGDQWRVRAQRLRNLAAELKAPPCAVITTASTTPAVPERGNAITHVCRDGQEKSWGADICGDCRAAVPERGEVETALSDEARRQMRLFAERCDYRGERCKSCRFLLRALDEIDRLNTPRVVWNGTFSRPTPEGEDARRMQQERDAYKLLSEGQAGLLVAYRTQSLRTPEGALRKIERAQNQLAKLSTPTRSERDGALSPQPKEGA